ncbi:type III secretion system (T3SS) inner membrane Yop/YscD-like protein [Geodermatophilus tzadiensis]|uniref:Type III secretion system (T3SS) inner membrane Yop/YscD-like protein n=1 Tax=Geodermatophilus tzadiensis TaxID=1137988 RepID=A0A2T0U157_9ACTN|nr:FHA domain-containing protein [Geodermatophilus tzadiensis]PRY51639.1 type III secretion system (T3SS) inner membrane Yop/YscD-like protein [Geodermatophilus tzadiensis]
MITALVAVQGQLEGQRFPLGRNPVTLGRGDTNDIVLTSRFASRVHAEVRREGAGYVLADQDSDNGTWVNGVQVGVHTLEPGDEVRIGDEVFRFETWESATLVGPVGDLAGGSPDVLRVTITGGGPVGLTLALLLDHLMGPRVAVRLHDRRWTQVGDRVEWSGYEKGNVRREQVVTLQSRQYLRLPPHVQDRLFASRENWSEMWPVGPDSIEGAGPRNTPVRFIEDTLLDLAGERSERITLVPERFDVDAARDDLAQQHVLAVCEGGRSRTREHLADRFGAADTSMYSVDGEHVSDMVLGLRVRSGLPDPTAVLLTVSQNRFLLNSLRGEGFLNMRLTDQEAQEAVGINPVRQVFTACIQSAPCVLERQPDGEFMCETHHTFFLPALLRGSALWTRVQEGLRLFGVPEDDLTAVTGFRLDMVQRPRFTAQLLPPTRTTPGTFACLLGDAGNAIHFWPGRGLNSGLASAISLARTLATVWHGRPLRDADFVRHEAVMAMLQYRHKTRAWRQMVTIDATGRARTIKGQIAQGIAEGEQGAHDRATDTEALLQRLRQNRARLESRLPGLPDDAALRAQLEPLSGPTLHTLAVSGSWDTANVGGEEVDVGWLLPEPEPAAVPAQPADRVTRRVSGDRPAAAPLPGPRPRETAPRDPAQGPRA